MGRRLAVLALVLAAALSGVPVAAGDCAPGDGCPMAGVGCGMRADSCPRGAVWSVAMTCCGAPATPATAPVEVATIASAAAQPAPIAAAIERAPEPPAPAPTAPSAERDRAERRHAVGLFTLFLVLLN